MWLPSSLSMTEKDLKKYAIIQINLLRKIFKSFNIIFLSLFMNRYYEKKLILLIGGTGQLGSAIVKSKLLLNIFAPSKKIKFVKCCTNKEVLQKKILV